jgi:transcriptional regulator with XRE-family HTH domain
MGGAASPRPAAKSPALDIPVLAAELAQMLELASVGLLHRRKRLRISQLKTAPQNARRQLLFTQVPLAALAAALGVTPSDLVQVAPTGVEPGIAAFAAMTAATGTPEDQRRLLAAMLDDPECPLAGARLLAPASDRRQAAALLPVALRRETEPHFKLALDLAGEALGLATLPQVTAAPGYRVLHEHIAAAELERPAQAALAAGLAALGLLADTNTAQSLIDTCLQAGLSSADPKLDALQINAALPSETSV